MTSPNAQVHVQTTTKHEPKTSLPRDTEIFCHLVGQDSVRSAIEWNRCVLGLLPLEIDGQAMARNGGIALPVSKRTTTEAVARTATAKIKQEKGGSKRYTKRR